MAVRTGYKQTEVGIIPVDWGVRFLPDVCRFRGGKAHEQYISESGPFVCVNSKFISTAGSVRKYSSANFCRARRDDILMVMSDLPNGKALAKAYIVDQDDLYAVNQRVCALTPYRDSSRYLYYVLSRNPYFLKFNDGVNQTHLLNPVFRKCPVPLPPTKAEQVAIAEALSDADALIESLEQLIAKKRLIKQGTMRELLTGERRLPGFSGEWVVKRLGDLCAIAMGRTPSRQNAAYWGLGFKWLSIADMKGKVVTESKEEITSLAAAEMRVVREGTLLMSFKLSIGRLCFAGCDLYTNEAICSFSDLETNAEYLYYALRRTDFSLYGKQAVKGYTLNSESLKTVEVLLPELEEQVAIATVLSDMDAEISALEVKLSKARQIKQGMMQELLTGRIRLV